jgi:hypothetical protein
MHRDWLQAEKQIGVSKRNLALAEAKNNLGSTNSVALASVEFTKIAFYLTVATKAASVEYLQGYRLYNHVGIQIKFISLNSDLHLISTNTWRSDLSYSIKYNPYYLLQNLTFDLLEVLLHVQKNSYYMKV